MTTTVNVKGDPDLFERWLRLSETVKIMGNIMQNDVTTMDVILIDNWQKHYLRARKELADLGAETIERLTICAAEGMALPEDELSIGWNRAL